MRVKRLCDKVTGDVINASPADAMRNDLYKDRVTVTEAVQQNQHLKSCDESRREKRVREDLPPPPVVNIDITPTRRVCKFTPIWKFRFFFCNG